MVHRVGRRDVDRFERATGKTPERLARALQGDLDLVLLKALSEDPDQRYRSVGGLAQDLRAWLDGHPVTARPPSLGYRFGKFTRRNRWVLPTASLFALLLGAYVTSVVRSAARIAEERDRAQVEAETAGEVTDFLVGLFGQASPYVGGSVDTPARELLDEGAKRLLSEPVDDPVVHARIVQAVAQAYLDFDLAREASELLDEAYPDDASWSGVSEDQRLLLVALHGHASSAPTGTQTPGRSSPKHVPGEKHAEKRGLPSTSTSSPASPRSDSWTATAKRPRPSPSSGSRWPGAGRPRPRTSWYGPWDRQFHLATSDGPHGAAEALVYERIDLVRAEYGERSPPYHHALDDLVSAYMTRGAFGAALPIQLEAHDVAVGMYGEESPTSLISAESLASLQGMAGEHHEALRLQQRVLDGRLESLGPDHILIPITRMRLSRHLRESGDPDAARDQIERALPPTRRMFGDDNVMTARMLEELGMVRWAQGSLEDADSYLGRAGGHFRGPLRGDGCPARALGNRVEHPARRAGAAR